MFVTVPDSVRAAVSAEIPFAYAQVLGDWQTGLGSAAVDAGDAFACAVAGRLPESCKLELSFSFAAATRSCGIILRGGEQLEYGYQIRFEPGRARVVFDQWPRPGDVPHAVGLERPLELRPDTRYEVCILLDGTVCEVYVNRTIALSARLYDHVEGGWGVFVSEGSASFQAALFGR